MVKPIERTCRRCNKEYTTGDAVDDTDKCPHCGEPLLGMSLPSEPQGEGWTGIPGDTNTPPGIY